MNEDALQSEVRLDKNGKRKAEYNIDGCPEGENARFGVKTSDLPGGLQPSCVLGEPTGGGSPEGVTANQAIPTTAHVAEEENSVAEVFWALLEQAGYTVW